MLGCSSGMPPGIAAPRSTSTNLGQGLPCCLCTGSSSFCFGSCCSAPTLSRSAAPSVTCTAGSVSFTPSGSCSSLSPSPSRTSWSRGTGVASSRASTLQSRPWATFSSQPSASQATATRAFHRSSCSTVVLPRSTNSGASCRLRLQTSAILIPTTGSGGTIRWTSRCQTSPRLSWRHSPSLPALCSRKAPSPWAQLPTMVQGPRLPSLTTARETESASAGSVSGSGRSKSERSSRWRSGSRGALLRK
mmetsp:Transcript_1987/g.4554  ORF Transcript_1987/g.4554 Transcript_1987/m.4554 type:complete len:247 (+) Transcript_1987:898-1638(+)